MRPTHADTSSGAYEGPMRGSPNADGCADRPHAGYAAFMTPEGHRDAAGPEDEGPPEGG